MVRIERSRSSADVYHVVSRGTGRQLIFEDDADREQFLRILQRILDESGAELYAWVLMGNHFHLLLHAPLDTIAVMMKRLCGSYALRFNEKTGRVGHLFQERYKSEPVNDDAYLLTVIRYIHENPEKGGLGGFADYRWSSYAEYAGKSDRGGARIPNLCATEFPLGVFGGVERFVAFHRNGASPTSCLDVDSIRTATRAMPDERAIAIAKEALGGVPLDALKALPKGERRELIRILKERGLSVRQIERLTGIGRNVIANVK